VLFGGPSFSRARELLDEYHFMPGFGLSDASNVVLAEHHGTVDILTTAGLPPYQASRRSVLPYLSL
jgi:hypothetical protein